MKNKNKDEWCNAYMPGTYDWRNFDRDQQEPIYPDEKEYRYTLDRWVCRLEYDKSSKTIDDALDILDKLLALRRKARKINDYGCEEGLILLSIQRVIYLIEEKGYSHPEKRWVNAIGEIKTEEWKPIRIILND